MPPEAPKATSPRILIVDDDDGIVRIVQKSLEQLPTKPEIFTAPDGVEALKAVEEHKPDLVILDVMMPKMDGFAVCDHLRKDIRTSFLPIIMLTASAEENNRSKGYLVGTDDYVTKPFEVPDFLARVSRLLRRTYGL